MFTGIIEELGIVTSLIQSSQNTRLTISAQEVATEIKIGESIAVNGVCLTAANFRKNFIEFDISPQTLHKSTLRDLKVGEKVNLERALKLSTRLGGHLVTGHVDGIGEIRNIVNRGKSYEFHISIPSELLRFLVPRGSITLDGISLTVSDVRGGLLLVSIIPHTASVTTLKGKRIGHRLNIEVDILSKYMERHLMKAASGGVTEESLAKMGFFPMGWIDN